MAATEAQSFADWLAELLARRGITQTQLAAYIGVQSPSSVSEWLAGKRTPRPPAIEAIARYAGVPVEDVLRIAGHLQAEPGSEITPRPLTIREEAAQFFAKGAVLKTRRAQPQIR